MPMSETQQEAAEAPAWNSAAELRDAMRDDRYWDRDHPEREDYVQRVTDGWQRLEELAQAREDAAAPRRGGAEPVGAPGPDMTLGRPMVVFIGGAGDSWFAGPVSWGVEGFARSSPGADVHYFTHDRAQAVRDHIDSLPAGTRVSLVGHSYGGDTAAEIAAAMGREGRQIDNLVTVDPVRREPAAPDTNLFAAIRAGAANWTNINATGGSSLEFSNIIAGLGRGYGTGPRNHADRHIDAAVTHRRFWEMLDTPDADGQTALGSILAP
jgi:pimeloyl-ACP methyl ester carboxylesterase